MIKIKRDQPRQTRNIFLIALLFLLSAPSHAVGMKGNLNGDEIEFFKDKVDPILITYGYCTRVNGDCVTTPVIACASFDTLSCEVWGVTNKDAIRAIILAVLQSNLNVEQFTFWAHKENNLFDPKSILTKPLAEYINHSIRK